MKLYNRSYIKEAERQLDTENYRKLQEDPTATNMKLVNDTKEKFKKQKLERRGPEKK